MADRPSPFSVWLSVITRDTAGIWKIFNSPPVIFIKLSPLCSLETLRICSLHVSVWSESSQSCPNLCDPMDYTVHRILQARILEWVAFPFSRGSSQPRDGTQVSRIAGGFFTSWATKEAHSSHDDLHTLEASCHVAPYCFYFSSSWILYTIQLFLIEHGFSLCPSCFSSPGLSRTANCHSWHSEMNFWAVEKSVPGSPGGLWLKKKICLPIQEIKVWPLTQEDPTCHRATNEPVL